jgi:Rrf2 family iron-sulfur cluster assembly transcriptional regulator
MNTLGYGKVAQTAISAMSHLAVHYDEGATCYNATDFAEARNLPKPLVAKVLTILAQSKYIEGTAGPKGGYALVVPPEEVTFFDVVTFFEKLGERPFCPFGPGWCKDHNPCAVHNEIERLHESVSRFLKETHFGMLEKPEP